MTATYESARAIFANWNVDAEAALARLAQVAISIHSWQGDDVRGFEGLTAASGGGIQATGNFPGRARNPAELRADLDFALSQIPGRHRLNLHAFYMDTRPIAMKLNISILYLGSIGRKTVISSLILTQRFLPIRRQMII